MTKPFSSITVGKYASGQNTKIYVSEPFPRSMAIPEDTNLVPLYSAKSITIDTQLQTFTDQSFNEYDVQQFAQGIQTTGTIAGVLIFGDEGHKRMSQAAKYGMKCKIKVEDLGIAEPETYDCLVSVNKERGVKQFGQVTYTLVIFPVLRIKLIDEETYVITFIDGTSLTAPEISNIQSAVIQLRSILAAQVYGSTELADKYVKVPVTYMDERYMIWPTIDYRDSIDEPKKYLFLAFVDESHIMIGPAPYTQRTENSYHYVPRDISVEPTQIWTSDYNEFLAVYPDFDIFKYLIFAPTGRPPTDRETAFNAHIIDVVTGNNGYPNVSQTGFAAKPDWNENASGQELYDAIVQFIS